jgi:DNA-binding MarR family transcriptional regulator
MAVLSTVESADFKYLLHATGLTKGNLSAHLRKLEAAGYLTINKGFKGNYPHTTCALTRDGAKAFKAYRGQYLRLAKKFERGV